jgi:hypothetical protein
LQASKDDEVDNVQDAAFAVLDGVAVAGRTRWFIVYVPTDSRVFFRTTVEEHVKSIDLARLNGDCTAPVKMVDIDYAAEGNITATLDDYSADANLKLVKKSIGSVAAKLPAGTVERAAKFPEALACKPAAP